MSHHVGRPGTQRAGGLVERFGIPLLPLAQESEVIERERIRGRGRKLFEPLMLRTLQIAVVEIDGAEIGADQACVALLECPPEERFSRPPIPIARYSFRGIP